jgi:type I restriction enzyme S subunit
MMSDTLDANAEIIMGQSPAGENCNTIGEGLPLLNGPTEYGSHHPHPVQFTTDARKVACAGDVLFCVRGSTTGRMNWADQEYAIGRGVAAIRHKKGRDYQPFVRAVIEFGLPVLLVQATGSTFPNVSGQQLASLWWPPLDVPEQLAIAHILGTLDDKIELNRRMSATLEAMARAIFEESIDRDSKEHRLDDLCEISDGPHATPKTVPQGPIFLGISNLSN